MILTKTEDIPKASIRTTFFNTIAALLAAFAIIPAVFAFNIIDNEAVPQAVEQVAQCAANL